MPHGQATTSSATTRSRATAGPCGSQTRPVERGEGEDAPDEPPGQAVAQLQDLRPAGERLLDDREELPDPRLLPRGLDPHDDPGAEVRRARAHRVALGHRAGDRLAGQDRVVERGAAGQDDAVDRHQLARAHLHAVARGEAVDVDLDGGRVEALAGQAAGELHEGHPAQAVGALEGRPLGAALHLPRAEQRRHQHGERVEPDGPAPAHRVPGGGGEGDAERQGDREVHVHDARAQSGPGGLEERPGREEHHGQRDARARPSGSTSRRGRPCPSTRRRRGRRAGTSGSWRRPRRRPASRAPSGPPAGGPPAGGPRGAGAARSPAGRAPARSATAPPAPGPTPPRPPRCRGSGARSRRPEPPRAASRPATRRPRSARPRGRGGCGNAPAPSGR